MKELILVSPKFSSHIGGMETHAIEFAYNYIKNRNYSLSAIFTKDYVTDGVKTEDSIKEKRIKDKVLPILTEDYSIDYSQIRKIINIGKGIFFLNSPTWVPLFMHIEEKFQNHTRIVRSGGNDIEAGWIGSENNNKSDLDVSKKHLVSLINEHTDCLIVNSNFSFKRALKSGIKPNIMKIISGGVNCSKFKPTNTRKKKYLRKILNLPKNKFIIFNSSRLVNFKGLEYSIKAFHRIVTQGYDAIFLIAGNGPEKKNLINLVRNLNIKNRVIFLDAIPYCNIHQYYTISDLFIHLPIYELRSERNGSYIHTETMGRSLCEAAASGLPCISSNIGGITEIIVSEKTGFIVEEKDYLKAADLSKELIENLELRKRVSRNAREFAYENFRWGKIFNQYNRIFEYDNG